MSEPVVNHGFLKDGKGQSSSMRIGFLLTVASACYVAIVGVHNGADLLTLAPLVLGMLGAAGAAKVAQKGREGP